MSQFYPVILQIGSQNIIAGFAGDAMPTVRKRTFEYEQLHWNYDILSTDLQQLEMELERVIHKLFTNYLLVDAKRCKALVLEKVLLPKPIKDVITKVLLFHLHAQSAMFYAEPIMSCVSAGSHSGIVIDLGWYETTITPVFDLRVLYNLAKKTTRAGKSIHEAIQKETGFVSELVEKFIAEVSFCPLEDTNNDKDDLIFTFNGIEIKNSIRYSPYELLFEITNTEDDNNHSIPQLVNILFNQLNIDLHGSLSDKIIITGGLSYVPGVKSRIINELKNLNISAIKSLGAWEGASLYCSTALMSPSITQGKLNELSRDKYLTGKAILVDWVDQVYQR